jgi:hypothetical protein
VCGWWSTLARIARTEEETMDDMGTRLARAEREIRRLRLILVGMAVLFGAPMALGAWRQDVQDVVRAREIRVVDDAGQPFAVLGKITGDSYGLGMTRDGQSMLLMLRDGGGATVAIGRDGTPQPLVMMGYARVGPPFVAVHDQQGDLLFSSVPGMAASR